MLLASLAMLDENFLSFSITVALYFLARVITTVIHRIRSAFLTFETFS